MSIDCDYCGEPIDTGTIGEDDPGEVHLTVGARVRFRDSWNTFARLHVDCFTENVCEGRFDADSWREKVMG